LKKKGGERAWWITLYAFITTSENRVFEIGVQSNLHNVFMFQIKKIYIEIWHYSRGMRIVPVRQILVLKHAPLSVVFVIESGSMVYLPDFYRKCHHVGSFNLSKWTALSLWWPQQVCCFAHLSFLFSSIVIIILLCIGTLSVLTLRLHVNQKLD